jgi:anti-repressor protein
MANVFYQTQTGNTSTDLVYHNPAPQEHLFSARELHAELESNRDFSNWIKYQIEKYSLVDGRDYISFNKNVEREIGATQRIEYGLKSITYNLIKSSDTGTEGLRTRCELIKKAHDYDTLMSTSNLFQNPDFFRSIATTLEQNQKLQQKTLQLEQQNTQLEQTNKQMTPAFEYCQDVRDTEDLSTMQEVAKNLNYEGVGPNQLFEILRKQGILKSKEPEKNQPYSAHRDKFVLRENQWTDHTTGKVHITYRTYVTMRGKAYINKLLKKLNYQQKHKNQ